MRLVLGSITNSEPFERYESICDGYNLRGSTTHNDSPWRIFLLEHRRPLDRVEHTYESNFYLKNRGYDHKDIRLLNKRIKP